MTQRPSITHAPGHNNVKSSLQPTNTEPGMQNKKTIGFNTGHIGDAPTEDGEAAAEITHHAIDASHAGLYPGSTSKGGGSNPYHTSTKKNPVPFLQLQPTPAWTRET